MTVKELHDLLTAAIEEGKGGDLVLMAEDGDSQAFCLNKEASEAFVESSGNGYDILGYDAGDMGDYENRDYSSAIVLIASKD